MRGRACEAVRAARRRALRATREQLECESLQVIREVIVAHREADEAIDELGLRHVIERLAQDAHALSRGGALLLEVMQRDRDRAGGEPSA